MQAQEIFDKAIGGLLKQGCYGTLDNVCMYRGTNGLKCAIGHLIDDGIYVPEMEFKSLNYITRTFAGLRSFIPFSGLMADLQRLHDDAAINQIPFSEFKKECDQFALIHQLKWNFDSSGT